MIKLVIFDIDGVLTNGKILINSQGEELKQIDIKDIDAIFDIKRAGFTICAITGEKTPITEYFKNRFPWDYFFNGNKQKLITVKQLAAILKVTPDEICYIGDGKYDLEAIEYVGLPVCPNDAIDEIKQKAKVILTKNGGSGCIWELYNLLKTHNNPA
ncbi:MAG: HAD hydrolase family protein [Sporomusaceae bacterium]|jgi:D-sedoheptulose 7-phosphate isomerase|nr:HAD hydrolase family protein [Sporomusaceae bacterium]